MSKGRPKGSKSIGIPLKGVKEAVELVRMVYEKAGDKTMSFSEMAEYMKLQKGSSTPAVGAVYEYGLIERSGIGWKVSELGKDAIGGNRESVKEAFEKNTIFRDLSIQFGDKEITEGILIEYLRRKYKKGGNVFLIAKRFMEGLQYIKSLESSRTPAESIEPRDEAKWFKVIQLKYSLNPTKEISKLADDVAEEFENVNDVALKTLAKSIKENKNNKEVLTVLIDNLIQISRREYKSEILQADAKADIIKEKK